MSNRPLFLKRSRTDFFLTLCAIATVILLVALFWGHLTKAYQRDAQTEQVVEADMPNRQLTVYQEVADTSYREGLRAGLQMASECAAWRATAIAAEVHAK